MRWASRWPPHAPRFEAWLIDAAAAAASDEVTHEAGIDVTVQWRPIGVVGVIGPWNYPISTPSTLVLSALLTGNGVVLKPSEITPGSGAHYHRVLSAHLPHGLFGLVQGGGPVGAALVRGPVQMVAFTGSIATGQRIMREAATSMKRLVLELGGKDPMVVMPGADMDAAAAFAARESLRNSGQVCISVERVFVPRALHDDFVAKVVDHAKALVVGDPNDPKTDLGPMASESQRAIVLAQLAQAQASGASVALEGRAHGPGFWLTPSVLGNVLDEMEVAKQETFGPVVAISPYDDLDEAIRRANASSYGLGASVWGPEGEALREVGERMEVGMVGLNRGLSAVGGAPWVGWKMSGLGHTRSVSGMRQFLQPRSLSSVRAAKK